MDIAFITPTALSHFIGIGYMNPKNLIFKNNVITFYLVLFLFAAVLPLHVHLFIFKVAEILGLFLYNTNQLQPTENCKLRVMTF